MGCGSSSSIGAQAESQSVAGAAALLANDKGIKSPADETEKESPPAPGEPPPLGMLLLQATAAKAALGPLLLQADTLRTQLTQQESAADSTSEWASAHDFLITQTRASIVGVQQEIASAKERLMSLRSQAARRICVAMSDNALAYAAAIEAADVDGERDQFTGAVQSCVNKGKLKDGELVLVQDNGAMRTPPALKPGGSPQLCALLTVATLHAAGRAKVLGKADKEDHYTLSLWSKVSARREAYEEGYE